MNHGRGEVNSGCLLQLMARQCISITGCSGQVMTWSSITGVNASRIQSGIVLSVK